jgi:hypothetical protein
VISCLVTLTAKTPSTETPAPGWKRFAMVNPIKRARKVREIKYDNDLKANLPTRALSSSVDPWEAIPVTRVEKMSGT